MKYSQASLLKKQLDVSIQKLTATVAGLGVTDAVRMRLEVAYMSHNVIRMSLILIYHNSKIWRNWMVVWLLWHGIGKLTILMWMRTTANHGCP